MAIHLVNTSSRSTADYLAEALRRSKYGLIRPLWADMTPEQKDAWLQEGDHFIQLLKEMGFTVDVNGQTHEKRRD